MFAVCGWPILYVVFANQFYTNLFRPQSNHDLLFVITDALFRHAERIGVDIYLSDGALLCFRRFKTLCPWDHDVDYRFVTQTDLDRYSELKKEMDEQFGPFWEHYIEAIRDGYGFKHIEGCGMNELFSRHEYFTLLKMLVNDKAEVQLKCRKKIFMHDQSIPEMIASKDVQYVTMKSPRGRLSKIRVPVNTDRFLKKYGETAMKTCMPDHIRVKPLAISHDDTSSNDQIVVPQPHFVSDWLVVALNALGIGTFSCKPAYQGIAFSSLIPTTVVYGEVGVRSSFRARRSPNTP